MRVKKEMSDKKNWKEELRQIIKEEIQASLPSTPEVKSEVDSPKHETIEDAVNCPDCYPKIRELVFKKHAEETKDSGIVCSECGIGVKKEWESCPSCGSKDAREK